MDRRWLAAGLGWGLAIGCAAKATPQPPSAPTTTARTTERDALLDAVADAVDPGPQAPLLDELPPALRQQLDAALGLTAGRERATQELREALQVWDKLGPASGETLAQNLLRFGVGLILAERAVAAGNDDAELQLALSRVYWILDTPLFASPGMFPQILQMIGQLAQANAPAEGLDTAALTASLLRMFPRAGPLHRRTAAQFLRRHQDHPEVPRVLGRLADDELRREHYAEAVKLRELALARLGDRALGGDHIDRAQTCYRALALACGDAALQQARGSSRMDDARAAMAFAKRIDEATKMGAQARRLLAIGPDAALTEQFERGHLLLLLQRFDEAGALYERLRLAHPDDARPHAGLAKLAIQRAADFQVAAAQIDLGKQLQHQDRDFYEVALGTIGMRFLYEALPAVAQGGRKFEDLVPPMLTDLHRFSQGLRATDPPRAGVIEMIESFITAITPALQTKDLALATPSLRATLTRALALAQQFPESPDARRMVYLTANFSGDLKAALAAVRDPLPPALAQNLPLRRSQAQTWLDLALAWEADDQLPELEASLAALPDEEGERSRQEMYAAVLALRLRRTQDRSAGEQAAALYTALASEGPSEARVVALTNLGVVRLWLGDPLAATQRFLEALELDKKAWAAMYNLAATVLLVEGAQRSELAEVFTAVAREGETTALRLQALAWRHEQAQKGTGDVEQARGDLAAALTKERDGEIRGAMPLGRWGLVSTGTVQVSFNYSVPSGFEIRNEVHMTLWLIEPAPGLDALLAAAAPGKPKRPRRPG